MRILVEGKWYKLLAGAQFTCKWTSTCQERVDFVVRHTTCALADADQKKDVVVGICIKHFFDHECYEAVAAL